MKNLIKLIGYGAIIYAVAFVVYSVFGVAFEMAILGNILTPASAIITAYLLARSLNIASTQGLLKFAVAWVLTGLMLDVIITIRFAGWEYFQSWITWASYGLLFVAVLLGTKKPKAAV